MMAKRRRKTNKKAKHSFAMSLGRTAVTGLFGGLFWGLIGFLCYLLNFSKVGPSLIFAMFPYWTGRNSVYGQLLAVAAMSLLSVLIAELYLFTFSRIKSMWFSVSFGILLWFIVFFLFQPFLQGLPEPARLGWNTTTTTLCLFALYGLFVGYSISFDFEEQTGGSNYSNQ
ncbi:YqhR family membrane protein [Sporolactobacillus inulinus]|nr:YqhR family membrane protein [Sporolactobacillus inulinus]